MSDDSRKTRSDPLIGKQLGDYQIVSRLAAGGMARIYRGIDDKLDREAAVKVLNLDRFELDTSILERFEREARAVAKLEHENIVPIYQYGKYETEGVYFLAMKLIAGRNLAHELRDIREAGKLMDPARGLNIMTQIASAVDFAHSKGFIHRDIKPSNILIDPDDKAILTDLGLVLRPASETTLGTAFGTPRYIAPEQASSSDRAVNQSDIYALGVIIYEMLTGQTPFDGDSPMQIALAHISDPPPPPRSINPKIPEEVEAELLKALSKDAGKRHATATELVNAIRRSYGLIESQASNEAATQPTASRPLRLQREEESSSGRRPPLVLMALLGLIVIAALAFIVNGLSGLANNAGPEGGAPVLLIYDDSTFTVINEGDYTLETQPLYFVRGVANTDDDFSGDRIPGDILSPQRNCFQIVLASGTASVPPHCQPISEHRQGQETLADPLRVHWRSETAEGSRMSSFEVRYNNQLVTRCPTVARGEFNECRFIWPVVPEPVEG